MEPSPSGIEINPPPPKALRLGKRAAFFAMLLGAVVMGAVAYGYRRTATRNQEQTIKAEANQVLKPAPAPDIRRQADIAPPTLIPPQASPGPNAVPPAQHNVVPPAQYGLPQPYQPQLRAQHDNAQLYQQPQQPVAPVVPAVVDHSREEESASNRLLQAQRAPTTYSLKPGGNPGQSLLPQMVPAPQHNVAPSAFRTAEEDPNQQDRKQAFLRTASSGTGNYLASTRTPQLGVYEIKAGWEIPAVLEQAINSDLPGEIKALVSQNIYDTATGKYLLIPQGSRLVGKYDSNVSYGQDGVQVIWDRIIYPDGSSINLDAMQGLDSAGQAGLRDKVDKHYKRLWGTAFLVAGFSALTAVSQRSMYNTYGYPTAGQMAGAAVSQQMAQTGAQITQRNLNVQPTIKVPIGYRFTVRVNRDILFASPYGEAPQQERKPSNRWTAALR